MFSAGVKLNIVSVPKQSTERSCLNGQAEWKEVVHLLDQQFSILLEMVLYFYLFFATFQLEFQFALLSL